MSTNLYILLNVLLFYYFINVLHTLFFYLQTYYSKCLNLTPCITKRNRMWKHHLISFLCKFIIDFFFWFLRCSTKGVDSTPQTSKQSQHHKKFKLNCFLVICFVSVLTFFDTTRGVQGTQLQTPQTSKMENFATITNGQKLLTILAKLSILDICMGFD